MSKLREQSRVVVVVDGVAKNGVITMLYDVGDIALVKFDDGTKLKVPFEQIGLVKAEAEDTEREPDEVNEITITRDEFREAVTSVCANELVKGKLPPMVGIAFTIFGVKLMEKLFKVDND